MATAVFAPGQRQPSLASPLLQESSGEVRTNRGEFAKAGLLFPVRLNDGWRLATRVPDQNRKFTLTDLFNARKCMTGWDELEKRC
jgi:hypothetical protein